MPGLGVRASMLMKELCSYPWVRQTYGQALPQASWTHARSRSAQSASMAAGA